MPKITLDIVVQTETAMHVGTGHGQSGVLDARTARNGANQIYIPASTLKGRARYRFLQIAPVIGTGAPSLCGPGQQCRPTENVSGRVCAACNLFGSRAWPGPLRFGDLRLSGAWDGLAKDEDVLPYWMTESRTNVMLSRKRGVALEQRLFTTEAGAPDVTLSGTVQGYMDDLGRELTVSPGDVTVPRDLALLVAALLTITHLGGRKSRGLGRCRVGCTGIQVDDREISPQTLLQALQSEANQ